MMKDVHSADQGHDVNRLIQELTACRNALENVDALQQAFWKNLRMGVVIHDTEKGIVSLNNVARQLLGITEDPSSHAFAEHPALRLTREDGSEMPREEYPVNMVLRTGRALENYIVGIVRGGDDPVVWVLVNAAPVVGGNAAVTKVVVTFVDISERMQIEERLRLLAEKDALTELPNRRAFADILDREWRLAVRYNLPVSLVMIDIDFFKAYNDHYGHLAGDECLIQVSQAMVNALRRPTDFLARYGGEEFVLLLQNTDINGAVAIAEELRECVEKSKIPHTGSSVTGCVTISLGVAQTSPKRDARISELLLDADNALYRAKYLGKNQVVVAGE